MSAIDSRGELVELYLSDCAPMLQRLERLMLESDREGELQEPDEMFRILHTLKGVSAMMEYAPLTEIAHSFEDILAVAKSDPAAIRDECLQNVIDAGLELTRYFDRELTRIQNAAEPQRDEKLFLTVTALAGPIGAKDGSISGSTTVAANDIDPADGRSWITVTLKKCPLPHIRASIVAKSVAKLCAELVTEPRNIDRASEYADAIIADGFRIGFVPSEAFSSEDIIKRIGSQPYVVSCRLHDAEDGQKLRSTDQLQTVAVPQALVNSLTGIMGEVILAESAAEAYAQSPSCDPRRMLELLTSLRRAIVDADLVTSKIGMRDVGRVFLRMRRAIRGIARDLGKDIRIETFGEDVQVDKSILDILSDSMIHMVRNATDHGIEPAERRAALGKPEFGLITLGAQKKNDYLIVTVSDDGAGVDRKAILDKAGRLGKLTKPKDEYTDRDVNNMLLYSGFSTNETVTRYSGRGVGLDAVVRRVQQAGGRVSVESVEGRGTSFTLSIPITLLVIDGAMLKLEDGNEFVIPANAVWHIAVSSSFPPVYEYLGKSYSRIRFPGISKTSDDGEGYILLVDRDFGPYYIRASKVGMMQSWYVRQLPEFVADTMGRDHIYSGCVLKPDAGLCCVLDVAKLIAVSENGELSERQ